ncbi:hypothetical protein RCH33_141 [Flavobacterium daejeonense]|nr:hypothetical protein RCH33_141 [Flavobacterium daejeonense]
MFQPTKPSFLTALFILITIEFNRNHFNKLIFKNIFVPNY